MNTGAILNRINFGVAVAAGRVPGVSPVNWKGAEALRDAPVERQVDGVVAALLGGGVSPETRAILTTATNPFLASAAALDTTPEMARPKPPADPDEAMMMLPEPGAGPPVRGPARDRAFGKLQPPTKGLALIVGLAIGSPEFQRRWPCIADYFVKSGAVALVTMGLSPSFLRRTALGMELPLRAEGEGADLPLPARRGRRAERRGPARRARVLPAAAQHRDSAAPARRGRDGRDRSRRILRPHPALAPFKPLWDRGMLAPIHAVGSPSTTRSHFDAQDYMESGTPDAKGTSDGWLNRYLATSGTCEQCAPTPVSRGRA